MATPGYREIALTPLPRKPIGVAVAGAWQYLVGAHASVTGLFDALATVRATTNATEARGRLASDETDLLRAAIVFTSSGVDASCKRLLRDTLAIVIEGDEHGTAARKFDEFIDRELRRDRSSALARALKSRTPREELISLYVADVTRMSMQGSGDLRTRVRDALGITDTQLPADQDQ